MAPFSAFVLHRRAYGEKDLLLELWVRELGRVPAMAHRVRGSRGNRQAELVPYQLLELQLRGRGEVRSLQHWEIQRLSPAPVGNDALVGLYLNELLVRLLPRQEPEVELFEHYRLLLEFLLSPPSPANLDAVAEDRGQQLEARLRAFELTLLGALGYGLDLLHTQGGMAVDSDGRYVVDLQGGVRALPDGPWSGRVLQSLAALQQGTSANQSALELRRQQRQLLRSLLSELLGDRPLAAWGMIRQRTPGG